MTTITIGREGDYKINSPYVSRQHAKLSHETDGLYIEDLNSTGGTYVNGKKIIKKKITASDKIKLGSDYVLDINDVLTQLPMSDNDFQQAFLNLKSVYDNYQKTKLHLQTKNQGKMQLMRSLPMMIPGVLVMFGKGILGPSAFIIGGVLMVVGIIVGIRLGAKEPQKTAEQLQELTERFKIDYACPACRKPFPEMYSWESLKRQGKCPFCQRKFGA